MGLKEWLTFDFAKRSGATPDHESRASIAAAPSSRHPSTAASGAPRHSLQLSYPHHQSSDLGSSDRPPAYSQRTRQLSSRGGDYCDQFESHTPTQLLPPPRGAGPAQRRQDQRVENQRVSRVHQYYESPDVDDALDTYDNEIDGEPIVVGGLDSIMAPQLQQPVPNRAAQPGHDQDTAVLERMDTNGSELSSTEPQRNSLLGLFRFSWLGGSGREPSENGRNSMLGNATDLQSQLLSEDVGIVMKGWLEKCGQQFKTWYWRFFVLREDGVLAYYADEDMKKPKGAINVGYGSKADISVQSNLIDKKFVFMITTAQRNMVISAPSQKMMTKWIAKLHAAGATPSEPWDPSKKTVKFFVRHSECPHEWKRYDDPTSYIHMEGCLLKRGHVNKNWKNRFFRIERGELRYYTENQEQLKGSVPLKGTIVSPGMAQCPDGRKNYFVLTSKDGTFEMHLNAPNEQTMHRWIEALQEAQTALADKGAKGTVSGLALVVKRAEEIPLAKVEVLFNSSKEINVELERRTEALIVSGCPDSRIPVGSQLVAVGDRSVLRETYTAARQALRVSTFPLRLHFVLPPYKKGELVKKSRSGFENWKKRVIIVTNGEIHYYKQVTSATSTSLKHRKSFSLVGCYLNLIHMPGREFCIVVARSPSDKLVLETQSEEQRVEWASVIYCSIRLVSQGLTPGHIENLQLEVARDPSSASSSDLNGSFGDDAKLDF
ncbi:hypothetical protein ATCC90586_003816 [Pythium insidiosum]|nr:hypothetical protein ATCC90586_003816 [Pythium insidiosum]